MGTLHLFFTTALPEPEPEEAPRRFIITGFDDRPKDVPLRSGEVEYVAVLASNFHDPIAVSEAVDDVDANSAKGLARREGFEPPTLRFEARRKPLKKR